MGKSGRRLRTIWQSFATKLVLLLLTFAAIPVALYTQFQAADTDKKMLLLRSVQEEGRLIAETLVPLLDTFQGGAARKIGDTLVRIGGDRILVKLLFRPTVAAGPDTFYLIASNPRVPAEYLEKERDELFRTGILEKLKDTCEGDQPLAVRYINPAGAEEVLTSITPVNLAGGCWAVVTAHTHEAFVGSSIGQPYWKAPEVRVAAAIYLLLAVVVLSLFVDVWRSLRRFQDLAREIRIRGVGSESFEAMNEIPELEQVASEFDRLVAALRDSANAIRQAAEENAHALKAPLAVIAQAVEPLRRATAEDDTRGRRAIELIERSIERLDTVVSTTRRMEEATAEMIDPPRDVVDFSAVLSGMLYSYAETARMRGVQLATDVQPDVRVIGSEDLLETVIENLMENALAFSPDGATVEVRLLADGTQAHMSIADQGPGVQPCNMGRIFDRYFSDRTGAAADAAPSPGRQNFGIGLWIVRRNVEALGGTVEAANRPEGGFRISTLLPLAAW